MQELSTLQSASVFNQVYPIQKPDYARDVTEASKAAFVLVHLTSSHGANTESRVLSELWREAARKYGDIKFCEIRGDMCIEGYPDKNCPTILVYHDEEIVKQLVTLQELNGRQTKIHGKPPLASSIRPLSTIPLISVPLFQTWSNYSCPSAPSPPATVASSANPPLHATPPTRRSGRAQRLARPPATTATTGTSHTRNSPSFLSPMTTIPSPAPAVI